MGRKIRAVWMGTIILGAVAIPVTVIAGAFRVHIYAEFGRWTDWATIWAVAFAVPGVVSIAWDKNTGSDKASGQDTLTAEDELSATCALAPGRPLTEETDPFALEVHRPWNPTRARAATCRPSRRTCSAHTTRN